jgi:hypothetical protein
MRMLLLSLLMLFNLIFAMELDPEKGEERKATLCNKITEQFETLTENSSEKKYTKTHPRTSFCTGYFSGGCIGCSMLWCCIISSIISLRVASIFFKLQELK